MTDARADSDDVRAAARSWLADDPDPETRAELKALLAGDPAELAARFAGRLEFGTAGLRGELGAGPLRMNRVIVRRAAAGLARYLLDTDPSAAERGVLIGFDARKNSDVFALDTAMVVAGAGVRALLLPQPLPTPVTAFGVTHLGAAAGVVVTASHNPPRDNGYKVYLATGSQIVPPVDSEISARIDAVGAVRDLPLADAADPLIVRLGDELVDAYVAHAPSVRHRPDLTDVRVAYTPMHGVGGDVARAAFAAAGFPAPLSVAEQDAPDPRFPTVSFPNPEEPGAMDLLLALATREKVDIAIANDPDADRLAVAVPTPDGGWRPLKGDEIGWLLADHVLRHTSGADRLVVTTLVSSSLLGKMAADHGAHYAETFTGFKWIAQEALKRPDLRFVFGYEQALGYLVTDTPLDKDGITAALVMAELAAEAKADGVTVLDRLHAIDARYGRHVTAERSVRVEPAVAMRLMDDLRASPPVELGGDPVVATQDFPAANLLRFTTRSGARLQVRPSGTEPKVKLYGEAVDADPGPLLEVLAGILTAT